MYFQLKVKKLSLYSLNINRLIPLAVLDIKMIAEGLQDFLLGQGALRLGITVLRSYVWIQKSSKAHEVHFMAESINTGLR